MSVTAATAEQTRPAPSRRTGWAAQVLGLLRLAFLVWAAVELAQGHTGDAIALVVTFAVLHVPRLLRLPLVFDVAFLIVWTLQELGQVAGFWGRYEWWDTLVHGAMPSVLAPTAFLLLVRLGVLPDLFAARNIRATIGAVMVVF